MRRSPRQNVQSLGAIVGQDYTATDPAGVTYPKSGTIWTPRTIEYVARYGWSLDGDGIPVYGQVVDTLGPLGGLVHLPFDGGTSRKLSQWGIGGVPCLVTSTSPLKVRPILSTGGAPYTSDSSLDDITCVAPTSYTPAMDDPGALYQGTDLHADQRIFIPYTTAGGGGGGGSGGYYGDGSDGAVTVGIAGSGNSTPVDPYRNSSTGAGMFGVALGDVGFGYNDDTGTQYFVLFLLRDIFATTFVVPATITYSGHTLPVILHPGVGFRIFATTSVTINGASKICGDGWVYSGGVAGGGGYLRSAWLDNYIAGSYQGGQGGGGSAPGASALFAPYPQVALTGVATGSGAGGGTTGGGAVTGLGIGFTPARGPCRTATSWVADYSSAGLTGGGFSAFAGGCGGTAGTGGGGGGAGGVPVFVASPLITGAGSITANGAKGFAATSAGGGGGGGNPGPLYVITESITVTMSSAPGTGGVGSGGGQTGGNGGGAGLVRKYKPSTDTYS